MLFKKLGRFLKNAGLGVIKSLPIVNVIGEIKDLKLKKLSERVKDTTEIPTRAEDFKLTFAIIDLIDDGKINQSFDEKRMEKLVQIIFSFLTTASGAYWIVQEVLK